MRIFFFFPDRITCGVFHTWSDRHRGFSIQATSRTFPTLLEPGTIQTHPCVSPGLWLISIKDVSALQRTLVIDKQGGDANGPAVEFLSRAGSEDWPLYDSIQIILILCSLCIQQSVDAVGNERWKGHAASCLSLRGTEKGEREPGHLGARHQAKPFLCLIVFHLYHNHTRWLLLSPFIGEHTTGLAGGQCVQSQTVEWQSWA